MKDATTPIRIGNLYGPERGTGYAGNIWDKVGISPALTTMQGGGREPMILEVYEESECIRPVTVKGQQG